jgi:large subunit ribosomal protein L9
MQVILLERVSKLGQMGDVVDVKPGYARNFLLPQGKAQTASETNIVAFEKQKSQLEAQNLETKKEADALLGKLDGQTFIVIRSASDSGALYGSVSPRDAAEVATSAGFSIDRKQISLVKPIKELGLHEMSVVLHPEVTATIVLNVARSNEEAELQASGKSIQDVAAKARRS